MSVETEALPFPAEANTEEHGDTKTHAAMEPHNGLRSRLSLEPMGHLDGFPPLGRSCLKFQTVTAHQESHFPKLAMLSCINRGWGVGMGGGVMCE